MATTATSALQAWREFQKVTCGEKSVVFPGCMSVTEKEQAGQGLEIGTKKEVAKYF